MSDLIPKVDVPEGVVRKWAIQRFTVSAADARWANLTSAMSGGGNFGGRDITPGTYTKLTYNGSIVMSDVPAEMRDHMMPVIKAEGHCLLNGLGLGMVANAMLMKPEVTEVTVIELDPDVIALVAQHYKEKFGDKITIIQADALTYEPPKKARYGAVWHDIWPNICSDNLASMKLLHKKYGRRAEWQGSWCRAECERANRTGW